MLRPSFDGRAMKWSWSVEKPKRPIPEIVQPEDMDDEAKGFVRAAAQAEFEAAISLRDRVLTEFGASYRWLQASLLLVNAGGAAAVLNAGHLDMHARQVAGSAYVAGIILSLLAGYAGVVLGRDVPSKLAEIGGYWLSVKVDLLRSEEIETEWQEDTDLMARRMRWPIALGFLSVAAFLTGCVTLIRG